MEEKNVKSNLNDDILKSIKETHFSNDNEDEFVSEEEVRGLAVDLVELEEMHYKLVENYNTLSDNIDDLKIKIDLLESEE